VAVSLHERFAAAAGAEPLSDLPAAARAELAALLERADEFEDLTGKWQAALLSAERGEPPPHSCCGPPTPSAGQAS
jgi:hypothetical protein